MAKWFNLGVASLVAGATFLTAGCTTQGGGEAVFQPAVSKLIESSNNLKQAGKLPEAICRLEAAADLSPESFPVQYNLGILYTDQGNWANAIQHLEKAVSLSPDDPNGYYSLGYAYESLGNAAYQASQSPAEGASQSLPEQATADAKAAYQKALDTYKSFLEKAPGNDPARGDIEQQISVIENRMTSLTP